MSSTSFNPSPIAATRDGSISLDEQRRSTIVHLFTAGSKISRRCVSDPVASDAVTAPQCCRKARSPSADPRRRAVQVDLFPTGTVESVTVTKTFTPDLLGDFTGGGVDIRTKSIPDGLILSVSTSREHDSRATGSTDFLTYRGGGVDFMLTDTRAAFFELKYVISDFDGFGLTLGVKF